MLLKEVKHAPQRKATSPPPSRDRQAAHLPLSRLWVEIPAEARHKAVRTLSRIVGQHLSAPPVAKEVAHE